MIRFFTDGPGRHLVCHPLSVTNLHAMARELGINRCWYHAGRDHYDVPKRRIGKLPARVELITSRELLTILKGGEPPTK